MNDVSLTGKKIIFFGPKTFGYENAIVSELEQLGAEVTFHSHLPSEHPWVKAIFRLFPKLAWRYADRYFISWLNQHGPATCDLVFVVKGEGLTPNFLQHLKKRYPNSRLILHLWDSLVNCKHIQLKFPYFDSMSSFDPSDCKKVSQFRYRPLFFLDKYLNREQNNTGQGVFFIGTLNGDRPQVISRLVRSWMSTSDFKYWLFVRSRLELTLRKLFDKSLKQIEESHLIYKSMSAEAISQNYNDCAAVLDIEHPNQSGLTMRTFEVIASGKKLITTNRKIVEHDFYDPARICVIDRNNPTIPDDFLKAPTPALSEDFIAHHSLRGWILDIMSPCTY